MLAALVVGGLTAWYLGVRAGVIAAVATAVALVVAGVVPGLTIAVYALVVAWSAALYFLGPKMGGSKKPGDEAKSMFGGTAGAVVGGIAGQAKSWFTKLTGGKQGPK